MTAAVAFDVVCDDGLLTCVNGKAKSTHMQMLFMHKNKSWPYLLSVPHIVVDTLNNHIGVQKWRTFSNNDDDVCTRFRIIFTTEAVAQLGLLEMSPVDRQFVVQFTKTHEWMCTSSREGVYVDPNHSSLCACSRACRCIKGAERIVEQNSDGTYVITAPYVADEKVKHGYLQHMPNAAWTGVMKGNNVMLQKVSSAHVFLVQYLMLPNQSVVQWRKPEHSFIENQWLKQSPVYMQSNDNSAAAAITSTFFCDVAI